MIAKALEFTESCSIFVLHSPVLHSSFFTLLSSVACDLLKYNLKLLTSLSLWFK